MQLPLFVAETLGWLAFEFTKLQPFIPTYIHLILSALLPIYAGAHASLSRPSSAAKPKKRSKNGETLEEIDEEGDRRMEGLSPRDAIMIPVLAGCTLASLYFLIKWLQDPEILSKILNWYFALFSVFSVATMVSDGSRVIHSVLFPSQFVDNGVLFKVQPSKRLTLSVMDPKQDRRKSPLPGLLSRLPLPDKLTNLAWFLHLLPAKKLLALKACVYGILAMDCTVGIYGIEGLSVAVVSVLYYNFVAKPWWLTNLMGFGFCYGALNIMSPTTFTTGTLILCALFIYDIYFVFFTPMMVTVAKSLDIPIKLLFPRPAEADAPVGTQALSMLGLGDIVLPGIMIGLALRFDLFMFYLRKQTKKTVNHSASESTTESKSQSANGNSPDSTQDSLRLDSVNFNDSDPTQELTMVKADYVSVVESWGDRVWTQSIFKKAQFEGEIRGLFPKPYFNASITGYIFGMLCTLFAMQMSDHPQPALLYLVPCVVLSIWGTGLVRGEVKALWDFSDAHEEDLKEKKDDKPEKKFEAEEQSTVPGTSSSSDSKPKGGKDNSEDVKPQGSQKNKEKQGETIIAFSIAFASPDDSVLDYQADMDEEAVKANTKWQPTTPAGDGHADKRRKVG